MGTQSKVNELAILDVCVLLLDTNLYYTVHNKWRSASNTVNHCIISFYYLFLYWNDTDEKSRALILCWLERYWFSLVCCFHSFVISHLRRKWSILYIHTRAQTIADCYSVFKASILYKNLRIIRVPSSNDPILCNRPDSIHNVLHDLFDHLLYLLCCLKYGDWSWGARCSESQLLWEDDFINF